MSEPEHKPRSPLWSTLGQLARILVLGALICLLMFAIYVGLALFGI